MLSFAKMGGNCDLWIESFNNLASPLVKLDTTDLILDEERHHAFKEMVIWYMYGTFQCTNKKCGKKMPWNSTQCSTSILYRYVPIIKKGKMFDFFNCAICHGPQLVLGQIKIISDQKKRSLFW